MFQGPSNLRSLHTCMQTSRQWSSASCLEAKPTLIRFLEFLTVRRGGGAETVTEIPCSRKTPLWTTAKGNSPCLRLCV